MPRYPLDACIDELRGEPGRRWGAGTALLAVAVVPLSMVVLALVLLAVPATPGIVATALATLVMGGLAVLIARRPARESGGWQRALGFDLPEWRDLGQVLVWSFLLLVAQAVVTAALQATVEPLAEGEADNASFLADEPLWVLLGFAVVAVGVAPVLEELLFRGLVLRGLMLRLGFWPAAVVSSTLFGLFHATGFDASGVLVVVATGVFGLGLCLLTRRTGRLGPGIGVHALRNAVAVFAVTQL